jgi:ATP-dependent exoDNAse (exonuclease V) beta subunit
MNKVEKHPSGLDIIFYPENHIYYMDGTRLESVTTVISKFFPKFDVEGISKKYAKKHNLDPEQVKLDWKQAGAEASELGNNCHAFAEALIKEEKPPLCLNDKEQEYFREIKLYLKKLYQYGIEPYKAEYIIGSLKYKIAGTIDLLLRKDNTIYILDWKTNKKITRSNMFQSALKPIEYLDDCLFNKYSLQLNLYKYLLKSEKYFGGLDYYMAILYVTPFGVEEIKVPDMTKEIKKMLKY